MLGRDDDSVLRVALDLEVNGKRKRGRPKKTWKKQVEVETNKIGLKNGGCPKSSKVERWSAKNCRKNGVIPAISAKEKNTRQKLNYYYYYKIQNLLA